MCHTGNDAAGTPRNLKVDDAHLLAAPREPACMGPGHVRDGVLHPLPVCVHHVANVLDEGGADVRGGELLPGRFTTGPQLPPCSW
jgi:hypothetical protein